MMSPMLSPRRMDAIWGSLAAATAEGSGSEYYWSASVEDGELCVSQRFRSTHTRKVYSVGHRFTLLELEDSVYLPVLDRLRAGSRSIYMQELADCGATENEDCVELGHLGPNLYGLCARCHAPMPATKGER
jgi:hypothetical protein